MRYRLGGVLVLAVATVGGLVFSVTGGAAGAACANCAQSGFSTVQVDTQGTNASEPKILQSPTGDVFVNAPAGLPGPSEIWRSANGGSTWTKLPLANVGTSNVTIGGGDSDLAADNAGNLYLVDLWLGNSSTAVSTDNGNTWTGQPFGTVPVQDRPWVSADPRPGHNGTVYSVTDQPGTALWLSMAQVAGLPSNPAAGVVYPVSIPEVLYGPTGLPVPTRGIVGAQPPGNLVTDMNGATYNVYPDGTGVGMSVLPPGWPSSSPLPAGEFVTPSAGQDATNAFPVVAVDNSADKNVYVVWSSAVSATEWDIEFASSTDGGKTWSNAVTLGKGIYPWITADAPGKVDVAWYSADLSTNPSPYGGDPNGAPAGTQWDVAFAQSTNATSASPTFSAPVAAVTAIKSGAICTQGTGCSADRELGDFLSITHDPSGMAMIAYVYVPSAGQSVTWVAKQTSGTAIG
jgi:hypothetical protein